MYDDLIPQTQRPALMQEKAVGIEGLQREGEGTSEKQAPGDLGLGQCPLLSHMGPQIARDQAKARDMPRTRHQRGLCSQSVRGHLQDSTLGADLEDAC